jgi:hypothetical protein
MILILYFAGIFWSALLPRGDKLARRWDGKQSASKKWILRLVSFINPGPYGLKEHAVAAIMASSSSNASDPILVFSTQIVSVC